MSAVLVSLAITALLAPTPRAVLRVNAFRQSTARRARGWPLSVVAVVAAAGVAVWMGPTTAVAVAVAGLAVLRRRRVSRRERDRLSESHALLDAVAVMTAELSVGAHPAHACRQAANDLGNSQNVARARVATVVMAMAGRAELGGDVAAGLDEPTDPNGVATLDQASWSRVAVAWRTAERHGLPMGELLTAVREDLVARRRFAERTRAQLAGARATATVLALLPVLGVLLGQAMGANPVAILLGDGLGGYMLVVGTVLVVAGLWWTDRITARVTAP